MAVFQRNTVSRDTTETHDHETADGCLEPVSTSDIHRRYASLSIEVPVALPVSDRPHSSLPRGSVVAWTENLKPV